MDKKGPRKNGGPGKGPPADLSIPNDGELEFSNILSKGQVSGNKAILALRLTQASVERPTVRRRAEMLENAYNRWKDTRKLPGDEEYPPGLSQTCGGRPFAALPVRRQHLMLRPPLPFPANPTNTVANR